MRKLALLLLLPGLALAEDRAVPAEPIEIIVRGTKDPDTFTSTRAASTVTEKDIRDVAPGSLADALRGRAGVSIQQTTPGQGTVYVRGLGGREVMTLVDGVRLNTSIFRAPNNAALTLIDPFSIYAIEVIRGPSSVLHGSDALGGVLSLTTPLAGYSADKPLSRVLVYQSVTSNPLGSVSRLATRHSEKDWTAHVGLTYQRAGDVRPGDGIRSPDPFSYVGLQKPEGGTYAPPLEGNQLGTGFERIAADTALRYRLTSDLEVVVRGQWARRPELLRIDEITPRFRGDAPARAESFLGPLQRTMTSATLVHRPSKGIYDQALLALSWQRLTEHLHRRSMGEDCANGICRLSPARAVRLEDTRSDALGLRGEMRFLNAEKTLGATAGIEAVHDIITTRINEGEPRYPSGASMTQGGLFTQLEARLLPNLRAHAGGRAALFALNVPGRSGVDADLGGAPVDKTLFDAGFTTGARWEAVPGVSWVANVGRGVRSPNIEDYSGLGSRAQGRFQIPNRNLSPEHVHSMDTGFKVSNRWMRAETFVFYMRYDDAIGIASTTLNGAERAPDGTRYVSSSNVSRLDFYGVESDLRVGREDKGGVYLRGIAMTYKEETRPGVSAAERVITPSQLTTGVYWQPTPRLRLDVYAYARASMRRIANPDDNRVPISGTPGFISYHARASYQATRDITTRLSLDNITDVRVLEHGSGFYQPGFAGTVSLEARVFP